MLYTTSIQHQIHACALDAGNLAVRHHETRSYGKHHVHELDLCAKQIHQRDANDVDGGKTEDVYWQTNTPATKVLLRLCAINLSACFSQMQY